LKTFPVPVEITYGTERLAMYLQGVDSVFDIKWNATTTYGDIHKRGEFEFSKYNFEVADTEMLFRWFEDSRREALRCVEAGLPLPAYDWAIFASHLFNLLDARKAISVTERQHYILKIRELTFKIAQLYTSKTQSENR
jgi:glycyl-tRNA synthetase alpha chain